MATAPLDPEAIPQAGASWPPDMQIAFARMILRRAADQSGAPSHLGESQAPKPATWDALYGLATSREEPPSDVQVAEWLDEHRMEKYGR